MRDFFSFRTIVAAEVVQVLYYAGLIAFTAGGILLTVRPTVLIANPPAGIQGVGVVLLTLGNLAWRLFCEIAIVSFRIYQVLKDIDRHLSRTTGKHDAS